MQLTLGQLAEKLGAQLEGDANLAICGVAGIREAQEGDITFLANPKYQPYLEETQASAVIAAEDAELPVMPCLRTNDPSAAYLRVLQLFGRDIDRPAPGIDPTAVVSKTAKLGTNVVVGAHVVICDDVTIGDETVLMAGSYVGHRSKIGSEAWIYPNVVVREEVEIGNRCILHSGAVIGSDGFGFAQGEGGHEKVPQIGRVVLEDDVEVGANSAIDRATTGVTRIGLGTKIDNLVHIAHNVEIGSHSILCAQAGISGSTRLGQGVVLAGQAGLVGHIEVGDGVRVGAQGGVTKSIEAGSSVSGYPAMNHSRAQRVYASMRNLPRALRTLREMERRVEELEKALQTSQIENSGTD